MRSPFRRAGVLALALAAAALLRFPHLGSRPLHTDEAVQAFKAAAVLETGRCRYDPREYHGPVLPVLGALALRASGARTLAEASIVPLRFVPAAAGLLLVLVVGIGLNRVTGAAPAGEIAALFTAVSPVFVYYNRYYIHESLLVLFTALFVFSAIAFLQGGRARAAALSGASLGLMAAAKETWVLAAAAGLPAAIAAWLGSPNIGPGTTAEGKIRTRSPESPRRSAPRVSGKNGLIFAGAFCIPVVVFYTDFFRNPRGLAAWMRAAGHYLARAENSDHIHACTFYAARLLGLPWRPGPHWSEAFIAALALAGGVLAFRKSRSPAPPQFSAALRALAVWTLVLFLIYNAIPYKTPWCILSPWFGAICLAGFAGARILDRARQAATGRRPVRFFRIPLPGPALLAACILGTGVGVWGLLRQDHAETGRFRCDPRCPWVYAHTSPDLPRLARRVYELAALTPRGNDTLVCVVSPEYWPLPWYFRRLQRVGYWTRPAPDIPACSLAVAAPEYTRFMRKRMGAAVESQYFGLRPGVPLALLIRTDLWHAWLSRHRSAARSGLSGPVSKSGGSPNPETPHHPRPGPRGGTPGLRVFRHAAMNTEFQIRIRGQKPEYAAQAAEAAFRTLDRIESDLSRFLPASDISTLNHAALGRPVRLGPTAWDCLTAARRFWRETGGAFDVTARHAPPAEIGFAKLTWFPEKHSLARTRTGLRIDLGGIGKGYALDRMAAVLEDWGIRDGLVEGGQSTALVLPGRSHRGWPIALRDPQHPGKVLLHAVLISGAFSGSAAVLHPGHIIDPRTGKSASRIEAAWAAAPSGTAADALSTAFMVLSPEEAARYCKRHPHILAIQLENSGSGRKLRFSGGAPGFHIRSSRRPSLGPGRPKP